MLTIAQMQEAFIKCMTDKSRIYMIENFLTTYDLQKRQFVQFKLFPRQKDFLQALCKHRNNITTKPRQAGITTTTAAFITCELVLADAKSPETVLIVGNKLDLSQQMLQKIKQFLLQVPRFFWGDEFYSPDPKSEKNSKEIFVIQNRSELVLFNGCRVKAISSGENAARGVSSVSWLIFDEAAFIEKGKEVYTQAVATTSTGGHIIMISTPHGQDELYYETYNQSLIGKNNFHVTELKWYQDPRYNKQLKWSKKNEETGKTDWIKEPTIDSEGNIEYRPDRWKDLEAKGWKPTSPWYKNMCESFNNDSQKIAQELDVSFLGSSNNVVEAEYIDFQEKNNVRPPLADMRDPYVEETWFWKAPIEGHRYILCADISRGDAADRTAIEVIDIDGVEDDGSPCIEQVMEYHGKKFGDDIGEMIDTYGRLYGNALVVVDCIGGTGDATVLTLRKLGYPNLYYDDPSLKSYTVERAYSEYNLKDTDRLPGFHSGSVRFQMLSGFANKIRTNEFKIRSTRVIQELKTWIFKGAAGRIDHMENKHDDTLTCLAMGLFVMEYSFKRLIATVNKDKAMLRAWCSGGAIKEVSKKIEDGQTIRPKRSPIYSNRTVEKAKGKQGTYMWIFAGKLKK